MQSAAVTRAWRSRARKPAKRCDYRNCSEQAKAHGLCLKHYARMKAGKIRCDAMDLVAGDLAPVKHRACDGPCPTCGCPTGWGHCLICSKRLGVQLSW